MKAWEAWLLRRLGVLTVATLLAAGALELATRFACPEWGSRSIVAAGVIRHDPLLGWAQPGRPR